MGSSSISSLSDLVTLLTTFPDAIPYWIAICLVLVVIGVLIFFIVLCITFTVRYIKKRVRDVKNFTELQRLKLPTVRYAEMGNKGDPLPGNLVQPSEDVLGDPFFLGLNAGSAFQVLGRLCYSLEYNVAKGTLSVTVHRINALQPMDTNGFADPFVRVKFIPPIKEVAGVKNKTSVKKKTLDPIWNETFNFRVSYETIVSHNLVFFVYDWDASGNNRVIGAAEIAIAQVDFRAPIMQDWLPIKRTEYEKSTNFGSVCVLLKFFPNESKLGVTILECANLPSDMPNPRVTVTLLHEGKKVAQKTTRVCYKTKNPYYDEELVFTTDLAIVEHGILKVKVHDVHGLVSRGIGQVRLGTREQLGIKRGEQNTPAEQWMEMLANPRKGIVRWLELYHPNVTSVATINE